MNSVLQSGVVTPNHLASWTTDGVIQDSGVAFTNTYGMFASSVTGINFNSANTDNPVVVPLPSGYTRYRIHGIVISGASASLSSATCGVFTAGSAGGVAVVASGTAITVTATTTDTVNNMQNLTIANQNTMVLSDAALFFRVQTPQGSAAIANVSIFYQPMP
ncbi:MAG: hypothetical protein KGJ13_13275 [Patescibacteria group bacterium]|nr:hypothetical protein [Patescibacteria group bacterium]